MAVYNLRQGIPSKISAGDVLNYPYRLNDSVYGGSISLDLPKGRYIFEVWGSQGVSPAPSGLDRYWGTGGYAKGTIELPTKVATILTAGGPGFNGAQTGAGGASDIRLLANDVYHRVIVAGGGGAAHVDIYAEIGSAPRTEYSVGGGGGGPTGISIGGQRDGAGGTQTAGGASGTTSSGNVLVAANFGNGAYYRTSSSSSNIEGGCGGGGWYGGGAGGNFSYGGAGQNTKNTYAGGGGSGFVLSASSASSVPSGYALGSQYYMTDVQNKTGKDSGNPIIEPTGSSSAGHYGEGYVRITVVSIFNGIYIGSAAGKALAVKGIYIGDSNGKAKKVIKGYIGDSNGKAKRFL